MKLSGSRYKRNKRKYSSTNYIVKLTATGCCGAKNINEFKKGLDKFLEDMCMEDTYQKQ